MSQLELDPVLVTPLRRPETRPRRKRRTRVVPADTRVRNIALGIVVVAVGGTLAGRVLAFAAEPVMATWRTGHEIRSLEVQVKRQRDTNARLKQDIDYIRTPAGIEQEARRRGWVKQGEVALSVIVPEESTPAARPAPNPVQTASARSMSARIQDAIDTCLAVFGHRGKHADPHP